MRATATYASNTAPAVPPQLLCWVCVYNPRTGPIPRLVTQHAAVQDQEAHTTQHTHYTHIWTAVIHTLHTHTLSHSTPVMDRLMHSSLFLGRTRHGKNSDTMTRATRAFAYTRSIATGASPHTIHITRKYEWPTVGRTHTIVRLQTRIVCLRKKSFGPNSLKKSPRRN